MFKNIYNSIKLVAYECKRKIFSIRLLLVVIMVLIMSFVMMNNVSRDSRIEKQDTIDYYKNNEIHYKDLGVRTGHQYLITQGEWFNSIHIGLKENNNKLVAGTFIEYYLYHLWYDDVRFSDPSYLRHVNEVDEILEEFDLEFVDSKEYDRLVTYIFKDHSYNRVMSQIIYYKYFYDNDLSIINDISPSTFSYYFFRDLAPFCLLIACAVFGFELINEDRDSGMIKLVMSSSRKRIVYVLVKAISYGITVVAAIIIPVLVVQASLMIRDNSVVVNRPVIAYQNGFTSTTTLLEYFEEAYPDSNPQYVSELPDYNELLKLGLSTSPAFSIRDNKSFLTEDSLVYSLMPHGLFLTPSGVVCLYIVVIYFIGAILIGLLFTLIGIVLRNGLSAFLVSASVIGGIYVLSILFSTVFNPFNFINILPAIDGHYNFTYLSVVIVVLLSSLIVILISNYILKKIDMV